MNNLKFMNRAIDLSISNIKNNGGPFGCIIVQNDEIVAEGVNQVTLHNDPTAHAEIIAIREACKAKNIFNLSGFELYTSCEPCPMCLSAIYWAHIDKIYYGNSREDAAKINFDDKFIYEEFKLNMSQRKISIKQLCKTEAIKAFKLWEKEENKTRY